jgi:hypothetical protein
VSFSAGTADSTQRAIAQEAGAETEDNLSRIDYRDGIEQGVRVERKLNSRGAKLGVLGAAVAGPSCSTLICGFAAHSGSHYGIFGPRQSIGGPSDA